MRAPGGQSAQPQGRGTAAPTRARSRPAGHSRQRVGCSRFSDRRVQQRIHHRRRSRRKEGPRKDSARLWGKPPAKQPAAKAVGRAKALSVSKKNQQSPSPERKNAPRRRSLLRPGNARGTNGSAGPTTAAGRATQSGPAPAAALVMRIHERHTEHPEVHVRSMSAMYGTAADPRAPTGSSCLSL